MVSIIIVSFNTKTYTQKCLLSIKKYVDLTHHEVIVVDNGSNDGSVEMITKQFKWVKLTVNQQNLGFAKANNQGIKASKGDYILLLNSDTELTAKNTLEQLVKLAQSLDRVGAVVPMLLNTDGSPQASVFNLPTISNAIKEYWLGQKGTYSKYLPIKDKLSRGIAVEAAVMAAMLIPRPTIKKVSLLDEKYFMYFEDLDYCRRIKRAGLKVYYVPQITIIHHHGKSGQSLAKSTDQWKRLIPSSLRYHGWLKHHIIQFILWSGQKVIR